MAKNGKDPLQKASTLMAKALRRGEKLERTLKRLVAHLEPGSAPEDLLEAVQNGLKAIRKNVKLVERGTFSISPPRAKEKQKVAGTKPAQHRGAAGKPKVNDIAPPVDGNSGE